MIERLYVLAGGDLRRQAACLFALRLAKVLAESRDHEACSHELNAKLIAKHSASITLCA